mmetsp:Transcript_14722/g.36859  ORF Transcript_14722/g.36859 Transcript_14722/m.36859 type:complete len:229 (-) Transcript_14722:839-1525(-)
MALNDRAVLCHFSRFARVTAKLHLVEHRILDRHAKEVQQTLVLASRADVLRNLQPRFAVHLKSLEQKQRLLFRPRRRRCGRRRAVIRSHARLGIGSCCRGGARLRCGRDTHKVVAGRPVGQCTLGIARFAQVVVGQSDCVPSAQGSVCTAHVAEKLCTSRRHRRGDLRRRCVRRPRDEVCVPSRRDADSTRTRAPSADRLSRSNGCERVQRRRRCRDHGERIRRAVRD